VAILAAEIDRRLVARGRGTAVRVIAAALLLLNPVTFSAITAGHPEELLAGALCVGAVLAAQGSRPLAAGALLGLAVVTKQWAVLAALPVLAAAPAGRVRLAVTSVAVAAVVTLPLVVGNPDRLVQISRELSGPVPLGPANVWKPFVPAKRHGDLDRMGLRDASGRPLRVARSPVPRSFVIALPLVVGLLLLWWRVPRGDDAIGLLALLLLLRFLVDPTNQEYHYAPFVIALAPYESLRRPQLPVVSLLVSVLVWVTFEHVARDALTLLWAAWAVPLTILLGLAVFASIRPREAPAAVP
jgi:hypothetical protein